MSNAIQAHTDSDGKYAKLEDYKHIYKQQIIEMAEEQEDALFLQQIYTIMIRRKRKTGR